MAKRKKTSVLALFLTFNMLVSTVCDAETIVTIGNSLIQVQSQDEPLRTLLSNLELHSGVVFSYPVSIGEQRVTTLVDAPTWEGVVEKILADYSTAFIWNALGELANVNLLPAAEPIHHKTASPLPPKQPSGPPEQVLMEGDQLSPYNPPGSRSASFGQSPPPDHLAGSGPPSLETKQAHPTEGRMKGVTSGLFKALKHGKKAPKQP